MTRIGHEAAYPRGHAPRDPCKADEGLRPLDPRLVAPPRKPKRLSRGVLPQSGKRCRSATTLL